MTRRSAVGVLASGEAHSFAEALCAEPIERERIDRGSVFGPQILDRSGSAHRPGGRWFSGEDTS